MITHSKPQFFTRFRIQLVYCLFTLVLVSCATPPSAPVGETRPSEAGQPSTPFAKQPEGAEILIPSISQPPSVEMAQKKYEEPARELIQSGRYLDAAILLSELAATVASPQKQDYQLRIASLLLQGNYLLQAEQILQEINVNTLPVTYRTRKSLLNAQLALAQQNAPLALNILQSVAPDMRAAPVDIQKSFYEKQIDAHSMVGNFVKAAQARSSMNLLISDADQLKENEEILLRDLQQLSEEQLLNVANETSDDLFRGWVVLAHIAKTAADEQSAQARIDQWLEQYPNHPVDFSILKRIIAQQPQALGRATQVALILPTKGKFSKAAKAVQEGFLAAYYSQRDVAYKPKVRVYSEGDDTSQILATYEQAIADGADFVVGPLNKESVTELARHQNFQVPVLALNYGDTEVNPNSNFFQMSLSPEQEARQVAEHAWLDGHKNAATIVPNTNWGERIYQAFKDRWEELGGIVVENQTYDAKKSDYGDPIKMLLNIDESESRYSQIRSLSPLKLNFEPRRRQDVDMIFMAAFSRQGRLLRPQLRFHRASDIPVYATSHVYSGTSQPNMDRDMNDVKFSDMPWTLPNASAKPQLKKQIERLWPSDSSRYMRLFALGIDAYNVIPEINRLRRNRFSSYPGETGLLYLDISNRFLRRLVWAQFIGGEPRVLDKF